jgi:hypothetical protein
MISSVLPRVPQSTIWGGIGYHSKENDPLAQSFIDSLKFYGAVSQTYQRGNYGHFIIDSTGQNSVTNHGFYFYKSFIFKYSDSISILKKLVYNYGNNYKSEMNIRLYNSQGDFFISSSPPAIKK